MKQFTRSHLELVSMTRLFCAALLGLGLAACGESTDGTAVPTQFTGRETVIPIVQDDGGTSVPTSVVMSNTLVPGAPAADSSCGEIVLRGNPARPVEESALRTGGNCLARAFQACSPTALTIRDETNNLIRQFSVNRQGTECVLRQALQTDPNTPPAVADCQRVRADGAALVVEGCSHLGDFALHP